MIRHSPCERYIRYLLLDNPERDNAEIRGILEAQGLDCLGDAYLNGLRQQFNALPDGFNPRSRRHCDSFNLVRDAGVLELFQGDPREMAPMYSILDNARAKEFIEVALIFEAPANAIADQLRRYYYVPDATPAAVERYRWFYWDVRLVDTTELRGIIKLRYLRAKESSNKEIELQGKALSSSLYSDPRWIAANTPRSHFSALLGQISLGMMPANIDISTAMSYSRAMMILRVYEESISRVPDADRRALNWTHSIKMLGELNEQKERPEDSLRAQLEAITLRTDTQKMPYVLAVSNGEHTVDLASVVTEKDPHE